MSDGGSLRGAQLRGLVALAMQNRGLDVEARPRDAGTISQRLAREAVTGPTSDLTGPGVEGLLVHARVDPQARWSAALDEVQEAARYAGRGEVGVLVEYRRQRPIGDAWVVLTVADFARILNRSAS